MPQEIPVKRNNAEKSVSGELPMLMSVLGLSVMQSLVRFLGPAVSPWVKTFYRSSFTVAVILVWMLIRRQKLRFNNWPMLLLRGTAGAVAITFFFWAIDLIGLFTATLYLYVYPVFAIIFASLLFKERFSPWLLLPLSAAFAGLYLIVNPQFQAFSFGHIIGLSVALSGGLARAALRQLRSSDSPGNIVILFMGIAVAVSGIGATLLPGQSWSFDSSGLFSVPIIWAILIAIGLSSAFSHIMVTHAYHRLTTAKASIMTMLILPITAVIAVIFFNETMSADKITGGILIVAGGIGVALVPSPIRG